MCLVIQKCCVSEQNYNKSRIHSYRGAKDIMMTLDGTIIFQGEITRAIGGIEGGTEAFGDVSFKGLSVNSYIPHKWRNF